MTTQILQKPYPKPKKNKKNHLKIKIENKIKNNWTVVKNPNNNYKKIKLIHHQLNSNNNKILKIMKITQMKMRKNLMN